MEDFGIVLIILSIIIGLAVLAFWIWAIVDVIRHKFENGYKLIWLIVVIFLQVIGAVIYAIIGRKQRIGKENF